MLYSDEEGRVPLMGYQKRRSAYLDLRLRVPSRDERLAKIGDPKTPKMGGITPKTISVPEADNLLNKMRKAAPPTPRMSAYTPNGWVDLGKIVSFDFETEPREQGGPCRWGCSCPPCQRYECGSCLVDAQRGKDAFPDYARKYRGSL